MSLSFKADVVRSVGYMGITSSYSNLGIPLSRPIQILMFKNTTDQTVFISEDGSTDQYELLSGTVEIYDFQSNSGDSGPVAKAVGTQFSVRGVSGSLPTSGKVIIQGQYT